MEENLIHRKRSSNLVDHDLGFDNVLISASRGQQDLHACTQLKFNQISFVS